MRQILAMLAVSCGVCSAWAAFTFPTEHLAYHLDAFRCDSSVKEDPSTGCVTNWVSKGGIAGYAFDQHESGHDANYPYLNRNAFGGRGGVRFGYATDGTTQKCTYLGGNAVVKHKTVFIVFQKLANHNFNHLLGNYSLDRGIRWNTTNNKFPNEDTVGTFCLNGEMWSTANAQLTTLNKTYRLVFIADNLMVAGSGSNLWCKPGIGTYWLNSYGYSGRWGCTEVGEVLVYDSEPSAADRAAIEKYLEMKWQSDYVWIGGGATTDWTDAGNWLGGNVPSDMSGTVALMGDANVTVSSSITVGRIFTDGATVTLAPGVEFWHGGVEAVASAELTFAGTGTQHSYATDMPVKAGLTVHLDVSCEGLMSRDANGHVTKWGSRVGDGTVYQEDTVSAFSQKSPLYTAADDHPTGRPAVLFGYDENGEKAKTYLKINRSVKHRTLFFVCRPYTYVHQYAETRPPVQKARLYNYGSIYSRLDRYQESIDSFYLGGSADYARRWQWALNPAFACVAGGMAYIDGVKRYDYDNSLTNVLAEGLTFRSELGDDLHLLTIVSGAGRADANVTASDWIIGAGYLSYSRCYSGAVYEFVAYDRVLSDTERTAVERTLLQRYFGTRWTGGVSGSWNVAANWSDGKVPDRTKHVTIENAVVTVDQTAQAGVLRMNGVSLSIAAGKQLLVNRIDRDSAGNSIAIAAGGRFSATIATTEPIVGFPATITGSGTFAKRGGGTLTITPSMLPATLSLSVDDGMVDLAGEDLSVAGLYGGGTVTNSGAAATLTIASDTDTALEPRIAPGIAVVKSGAGRLRANAAFSADSLTLRGGAYIATSNMPMESIEGVTVHLDASRTDTIDYDPVTGRVSEWRSLRGNNFAFRPDSYNACEKHLGEFPPKFEGSFMANGMPCVYFGIDGAGAAHRTYLAGSKTVRHRTFFIVSMPKQSSDKRAPYTADNMTSGYLGGPYGNIWSYGMVPVHLSSVTLMGWNKQVWVNGKYGDSGKGDREDLTHFTGYADHPATMPHVFYGVLPAASGSGDETCTDAVVGGYYMQYWSTDTSQWVDGARYFMGAICEIIVFDREVSTAERDAYTAMLMQKWCIVPEAALDAPSPFCVPFANVSFDATAGSMPRIEAFGDLDITGWTASFLGVSGRIRSAPIVTTTGALTGPFASVTGLGGASSLEYGGSAARFISPRRTVVILR